MWYRRFQPLPRCELTVDRDLAEFPRGDSDNLDDKPQSWWDDQLETLVVPAEGGVAAFLTAVVPRES